MVSSLLRYKKKFAFLIVVAVTGFVIASMFSFKEPRNNSYYGQNSLVEISNDEENRLIDDRLSNLSDKDHVVSVLQIYDTNYLDNLSKKLDSLDNVKLLGVSDRSNYKVVRTRIKVEYLENNIKRIRNLSQAENIYLRPEVDLDTVKAVEQTGIDYVKSKGVYNGSDVTIAVMDTGINMKHEDLGNVIVQKDFAENPVYNNSQQASSHGTKSAGVIGGQGEIGDEGIAPGVDIVSLRTLVKVHNATGYNIENWENCRRRESKEYDWVCGSQIEALEWLNQTGIEKYDIDILSRGISGQCRLSTGVKAYWQSTKDAAYLVNNRNLTVVNSAGNNYNTPDYSGYVGSWGCHPDILSVASVGPNSLEPSKFSNRGNPDRQDYYGPDISAPSQGNGNLLDNVPSKPDKISTGTFGGTSAATAVTSGLIAIMMEKENVYKPEKIYELLKNRARNLDYPKNVVGSGVVNTLPKRNSKYQFKDVSTTYGHSFTLEAKCGKCKSNTVQVELCGEKLSMEKKSDERFATNLSVPSELSCAPGYHDSIKINGRSKTKNSVKSSIKIKYKTSGSKLNIGHFIDDNNSFTVEKFSLEDSKKAQVDIESRNCGDKICSLSLPVRTDVILSNENKGAGYSNEIKGLLKPNDRSSVCSNIESLCQILNKEFQELETNCNGNCPLTHLMSDSNDTSSIGYLLRGEIIVGESFRLKSSDWPESIEIPADEKKFHICEVDEINSEVGKVVHSPGEILEQDYFMCVNNQGYGVWKPIEKCQSNEIRIGTECKIKETDTMTVSFYNIGGIDDLEDSFRVGFEIKREELEEFRGVYGVYPDEVNAKCWHGSKKQMPDADESSFVRITRNQILNGEPEAVVSVPARSGNINRSKYSCIFSVQNEDKGVYLSSNSCRQENCEKPRIRLEVEQEPINYSELGGGGVRIEPEEAFNPEEWKKASRSEESVAWPLKNYVKNYWDGNTE